jgi:hypothetical protein
VTGESGRRLQTLVVETNGRAWVEAIRPIPGREHLVFEEVQCAWLREMSSPHVHEVVVAGVAKDLFKGAATTLVTQALDDPLLRDYPIGESVGWTLSAAG